MLRANLLLSGSLPMLTRTIGAMPPDALTATRPSLCSVKLRIISKAC